MTLSIGPGWIRRVIVLLALFCGLPLAVRAEDGSAGWLRYSRITEPAALRQYRLLPREIVQADASVVGERASDELVRGLHSMLGDEFKVSSALPNTDA